MKGNTMTMEGNTGEHTEKLRTSDAEKTEETVSIVEERLANLRELTGPDKPEKEASKEAEEDPNLDDDQEASDDVDKDSTQSDKDEDKDVDKDVDTDVDKDKDVDTSVDISPAYVQAALRSGWTQEDIDEIVKESPERADKIFGNLYNAVNQASREWSAIGRAKLNNVDTKPKSKDEDGEDFAGVDIEKLRKEYEDNAVIDGVVVPLNDALKKMMAQVKELRTERAEVNTGAVDVAAERAMQAEIDNFFSSDLLGDYSDFYGKMEIGKGAESLTYQQKKNRWDVLTEADAIVAGHKAVGKDIDNTDALTRAHLLITEPIRTRVIRDSIKKSVTKRSKSMTLKPSKGSKTSSGSQKFNSDGKPRTRDELVSVVGDKLSKMKW